MPCKCLVNTSHFFAIFRLIPKFKIKGMLSARTVRNLFSELGKFLVL